MQMNIKTSGSVILTEELREFAEKKIAKLEKLLDPKDTTILIEVELATTTNGQRTGDAYRAEVNVSFTGGLARAEASRETMHAAIDEAVAEARRELRRSRTRHRDLIRRGALRVKDFFRRFSGQ